MPVAFLMKLGRGLGCVFYWVDRKHRHIAFTNLRNAFPEYTQDQIRNITKRVFQNLVLVGCEVLILSQKNPHAWRDHIFEEGYEHLQKARKSGKAILFLTGHSGNWELLAKLGRWAGFINSVVARDVKNKKIQSWIQSIRARYDVNVISKGQIRHIVEAFDQGHTVGALVDQDGGVRGTFAPFFGRLASTPTGIIRLGLKYGVPILPGFLRRLSDRLEYRAFIGRDLTEGLEGLSFDEKEKIVLERFTLSLENFIREDPSQWLWLHRRWKTRPQGEIPRYEKKMLLLNDGKPGHFNQILAIANGFPDWEKNVCLIQFKSSFHRFMVSLSMFFGLSSMRFLRWSLSKGSLQQLPIWSPSLILACGSLSAPVAFFLKSYYIAKTVFLMKSGISHPEKLFDLVVLPTHDAYSNLDAKNILTLQGMPTLVSKEIMQKAAQTLSEKLNLGVGRKIGILIGGHSERLEMKSSEMEILGQALLKVCEKNSTQLLLATSRRTPLEVEQVLEKKLGQQKHAHLLWAKDYLENPIPGILGLVDIVLVTEDSFSMIMEAVHSGCFVVTIRLPQKGSRSLKYEKTLDVFEQSGRIRRCGPKDIATVLEDFLKNEISKKEIDNQETLLVQQEVLKLFEPLTQVKS